MPHKMYGDKKYCVCGTISYFSSEFDFHESVCYTGPGSLDHSRENQRYDIVLKIIDNIAYLTGIRNSSCEQ